MMTYEELSPGLFYFKNAIENPNKVIEYLEKTSDEIITSWMEWSNKNPTSDEQSKSVMEPFGYGKCIYGGLLNGNSSTESVYIVNSINNALDACAEIYSNKIGINNNPRNMDRNYVVGKYVPGVGRGLHIDCTYDDLEHSFVIYLNDDYEGGELSFPNLGIKIKPEAGSIFMFHSIENQFLHEGCVVEGSTLKYIIPHFWRMGHSQGYVPPKLD